MPKGLKRYYGQGHVHFLTFSCYRRRPLLGSVGARNLFVKTLGEVRARYGFLLVGYVVMPEHVHLLIGEPERGTPSTVLQVLKQRVSREMRRRRRRVSTARMVLPFVDDGPQRFWQPRFYDFNVWSEKKRREKLDYMHTNPVKRGLVDNPAAWAWSSFAFYETGQTGLVPIDPVS